LPILYFQKKSFHQQPQHQQRHHLFLQQNHCYNRGEEIYHPDLPEAHDNNSLHGLHPNHEEKKNGSTLKLVGI
jgi:hypothetical protein